MRHTIATAVVLAWLAACSSPPPAPAPYAPRAVTEQARWEVWSDEALVGRVRQLTIHDPERPLTFYRIEDLQGRWLGHANAQGRFSRRVPFQEQEEDLGVWSMTRGVAELLDAKSVRLQPVAIEADSRKR